jgi:hypothetical protein
MGPIAGAVMVVAMTAGVASVMIFRPLTKQLGELLDQMRRDRQQKSQVTDSGRVAELMERLLDRMESLEARQDFAERVIESAGWKSDASSRVASRLEGERQGRSSGS